MGLEKQLGGILSGADEVIPLEDLKAKLTCSIKRKTPLRVKLGLDPSAPDIHLGHAVVLRKLRQFQDLGHLAVLIVGDFTGTIGDPSGQMEKRKQLSDKEVRKNAETYVQQLLKVLDEKRTEVVYNSAWLKKLSMEEVLRLTACYTVARLLERDDFSLRYSQGKPISVLEFMYPLLQGYDSVMVKADVELGGTDQKFNLLVGREVQKEYGQDPQVVLTTPLLEGTDGVQKMSKSLGNYIGITESPEEIFGKVMSLPDELIIRYFRLTTDLTDKEVDSIAKGLKDGKLHPGETKRRLGREIVTLYYSEEEAGQAEGVFDAKFKPGQATMEAKVSIAPERVVPRELFKEGKVWVVKLLRHLDFVKTNSEARRLIEQGAVKLNDNPITSSDAEIHLKEGDLIQVGKRKIARLKPEN